MAPSRSLSLSRSPITITITRLALFVALTFALTFSSSITPVHSQLYSSADPNGPTQNNLIPYGNFANTGNGITDNTANFDAFIGNGYKTCLPPGSGLNTLCEGPLSAEPWTFPSVNNFVDYLGGPITNLLEYRRTPAVSASGTVYPYGEVSLRLDTTLYTPGSVLNLQVHVSQLYEAGTNETHYVLMDFYRGTYNSLYWGISPNFGTAANSFKNGYFDPTPGLNGAATAPPTFLFRDVIMAAPAASYPSYTNINHNRPLPASATFAILRYGVSSGPFTSTHPTSLFDVRLFARPLATGPTVLAYYDGPSPAGQTARVYFATTQCLIAGNFTPGLIQIQSANVNATITNFQLVTSGAEQLYALDLAFPTGVSGPVTIQLPGQSVFNYFNISNPASNALTLNVLTKLPHLTIYSPNYPVFPAAQQNTTIQYTFSFDTDVYGFDITRVGLCQTQFENDTCTNSQYIYVTPGTNTWTFPNNSTAAGSFFPDSINPTTTYYLILSNLPDATYRALVLGSGVLSAASQNMPANVTSAAPIRVDTTPPVISFVPVANTYVHLDNQLVFTVTFSEEVTGLNITQLNVTNGVVASITAITSAPNSLDPQNTWCYSTTASPCFSKYVVQVNHSGTVTRESVVLSYYSSPSGPSQQIFDLAGNSLNATGGTFPAVPNGVILFSNQNTAVSVYPYPADLLTGSFAGGVTGNKTNLLVVRYNFSFDYPVPSFNAAAQAAAGNLTSSINPTVSISWSATTKLDNYTFTANLTLPANQPTTNITTTLLPGSVVDVAGDTNAQSNTDILLFNTHAPVCQNVTYGAQERFATHEPLTNATTLTYTFSFDEPIFGANFNPKASPPGPIGPVLGLPGPSGVPIIIIPPVVSPVTFVVSGNQVIYTLNTNKLTDNGLNISVALVNATDLFDNVQFSFGACQTANFTLDYTAPVAEFNKTDVSAFAPNGTGLVVAAKHAAFVTKNTNVTITYEFSKFVNLVQSALQFQYEDENTAALSTVNNNIVGFTPFDCAPAPFNVYCLHFNVTVSGQDASYSVLQFNTNNMNNVTDLAGNQVANNPVYYYLTDQTPPTVVLSASYPLINGVYRSNSQNVTIHLTFSKHIQNFPGVMYGNCSDPTNPTNTFIPQNASLVFVGTQQTSRFNFTATFDVSSADRMTCQFYIGPNAVFDTVGNTLNGTTSIAVANRFEGPLVVQLYTPRGWLTNDLNPIPVCLTTDTAIDVSNLFGAGGANNLTANIAENSTIPVITDFLTGRNIQTTNRTYNATTLTFCANLLPITSDTDIRVVVPIGTIVDQYNNTNFAEKDLRIQRFDLNPGTYDNLVKDGIITNAKLANGSITNRNLDTGSVDQRALANFSVGTPQLQPGAVSTIDIADNAVNSAEIAPGAINATHLANNSVQTAAINDSAITNSKLAANAVTTDKILDGTIQTQDLANASITIDKIANNSVDTNRILDGAITTSKIANNTIVNAHLSANSVSTIDLMDRNVTQTKIAIGAVGSNELIDGNVTNSKLSVDAVTTDKILNGTILNADLSNSSISTYNIMPFTVQWNNMANNSVDQFNLVTGSVTTRSISNVSIINQHLNDSSVDHRVIAPQSIDSSKIIPRSIQAESLAPNVVATLNYQNGSILNQFIAANAINNSQIQPGAVDTNSIALEAVQTPQLGPSVVTSAKIAAGSVTLSHLATETYNYIQSIGASVNIPRPIAGSLVNDYSLVGTKLANKTVSTQQLGDSSVTVDKIAQNAVTWVQIAPQTINADNLGNSSVLSRAIAPAQIEPYHLSSDFFTGITQSLTTTIQGISSSNIASQSIDASQSIKPNTITESLLGPASLSLMKLDKSSFDALVDMYHRLALLEATVTALVNNIDSRCIFNTTFTIPAAATQPFNVTSHTTLEHTMNTMHPQFQAEIKRRSFHAEAVTALGVQPGSSQKYPLNIQPGTPYCGDGAGAPAGNTTGGSSGNSGGIINSGVAVSPSTLFLAAIAAIVAMLTH